MSHVIRRCQLPAAHCPLSTVHPYNTSFPALHPHGVEDDPLFLFFFLLAVLLFPIAVYFTILGMINRRPRPFVVSGPWDFVEVLLATSGFLLFVGPAMLSGAFRQNLRDLPIQHESAGLTDAIAEIWAAWWVVWLLYYLFVVGGSAILVWTRRHTTVIYNVESHTLEESLTRAAERLGLGIERHGRQLFIGAAVGNLQLSNAVSTEPLSQAISQLPFSANHPTILGIETFSLLNNVSLHWQSPPLLRATWNGSCEPR